jgi:UDP-N-acetylmuramoylalanine-D-glutamate ligase
MEHSGGSRKVNVSLGAFGKVGRMRAGRNIAITGLGQSGTTLACHLLNKVHDTVALSEPMAPTEFEDLMPDTDAVCDGRHRGILREDAKDGPRAW